MRMRTVYRVERADKVANKFNSLEEAMKYINQRDDMCVITTSTVGAELDAMIRNDGYMCMNDEQRLEAFSRLTFLLLTEASKDLKLYVISDDKGNYAFIKQGMADSLERAVDFAAKVSGGRLDVLREYDDTAPTYKIEGGLAKRLAAVSKAIGVTPKEFIARHIDSFHAMLVKAEKDAIGKS